MDASSAILLERASELARLDEVVTAAGAGEPRVVVVEGPAGIGKTALLRAARQRAGRAGFRVLAARGGELERQLSFGVARQLFEAALVRAGQAERACLLERPASGVAWLFGLEGAKPDLRADEFASQHALYWLAVRFAERSPVMLAIDDLHWADAASLRWLGYLVRRLEDVPILLALAQRAGEPGADEDLLADVTTEAAVISIRPGPLSPAAVGELARGRFGAEPQQGFVRACHEAAGGNPLFVVQLLDAARAAGLRPVDVASGAVSALAPGRVSQLVLGRLRRLSDDAVRVAELVGLLGTQAEVRHVRALSALTERRVLAAGDELARAGLLRAGQPLEFVHPVVRSSVYEAFAAGRRAGDHGRAARLLAADGAPPARVAMHLLNAPPAGDPWAVEILRAAAAAEVRPETRAAYLRRAVAEPAPPGIRAEVLAELGQAESLTYDARALEHLNEALRLSEDPGFRAMVAAQLAYCLIDHDRPQDAEPVLRAAIAELSAAAPGPGSPGREPLIALHVSLLQVDFNASALTAERISEAVAMAGEGRTPAELDLLGFAAYAAPAAGVTSAEVTALAHRALRKVDPATADGFRLIHCPVWALEFADRLDEADHWLLRMLDAARRWYGPGQFLLTASSRAGISCRRGALADAEQDARAVLELAGAHGGDHGVLASATALLMTLTEQGRIAEADGVLGGTRTGQGARCDRAVSAYGRGWLRVAQGRAAAAGGDFQEAGRLMREAGHDFPGFFPWRVGAATAQLALGRREAAAELARTQLGIVQPYGAAGPTGVALRTLGQAQGGAEGLELLAAACKELEQSPALLERAKAQLEFGAALRRAGHRTDARKPLVEALDIADRCAAAPVARRAREELVAAGGRPRRARSYGVEALTASELRVARRAVQGRTNREIAQDLFVTMKVVEKHLASAYRKLGIEGRGALAESLGAAAN